MIKRMRTAGTLLALIVVLVVISALFALLMARLSGLHLPLSASPSPTVPASAAAPNAAPSASRGTATHLGGDAAAAAHDADVVLAPAAQASAGPTPTAPTKMSAASDATKAASRTSRLVSVRTSPRRSEVAVRSSPSTSVLIAVAPTPEQLRASQCRTLQGYEAELATQIAESAGAAVTAAAETSNLSGVREQLAITRARRLELGC